MTEHAVVIAGAGPTGLMLAGELALAGVDVAIVERRASQELAGSRGRGLHSRTIEVLDQRGIADRFISQGQTYPVVLFNVPLDVSDFPTRHNYVLGIWQDQTERILAGWVDELQVPIYHEREVVGFTQNERGVDIEMSDGQRLSAQYLVGCDGGRSVIRKAAGIDFPGWDATTSWLIAEAEFAEEPAWGFRHDAVGTHAIGKREDRGPLHAGIVLVEPRVGRTSEPTLRDVRDALIAVYGTDFGIHSPTWISSFTDTARQAATYRDRRVLLAGDAAHVHAPMGGQG
ncbi:MAG TPA: FAD-dependent monooxygenase, partial [Gemmatimonadaceae bacterium]|nr:FAD-dependent monooxygenase [Gemmatimonadaceae bacterium]